MQTESVTDEEREPEMKEELELEPEAEVEVVQPKRRRPRGRSVLLAALAAIGPSVDGILADVMAKRREVTQADVDQLKNAAEKRKRRRERNLARRR